MILIIKVFPAVFGMDGIISRVAFVIGVMNTNFDTLNNSSDIKFSKLIFYSFSLPL